MDLGHKDFLKTFLTFYSSGKISFWKKKEYEKSPADYIANIRVEFGP